MRFCLNHLANEINLSTDLFVDLLVKVQKFLSKQQNENGQAEVVIQE